MKYDVILCIHANTGKHYTVVEIQYIESSGRKYLREFQTT